MIPRSDQPCPKCGYKAMQLDMDGTASEKNCVVCGQQKALHDCRQASALLMDQLYAVRAERDALKRLR